MTPTTSDAARATNTDDIKNLAAQHQDTANDTPAGGAHPRVVAFVSAHTDEFGVMSVVVLCPYCLNLHRHGYGEGVEQTRVWRLAHCARGEYKIAGPSTAAFPWTFAPRGGRR